MKVLQLFNKPYNIYLRESNHVIKNSALDAHGDVVRHKSTNEVEFIPYTVKGFRDLNTLCDIFTNNHAISNSYIQNSALTSLNTGKRNSGTALLNAFEAENHLFKEIHYLNFTTSNIVLKDIDNIPKIIYMSNTTDKLFKNFVNKFVILTTYNLTNFTDKNSANTDSLPNIRYIETLYERYKDSSNISHKQTALILKYYMDHYSTLTIPNTTQSNNVTINCYCAIDASEFNETNRYSVFLSLQNLLLTTKDLTTSPEHPHVSSSLLSIDSNGVLAPKNNTFEFFIVDNDNFISNTKYTYICNQLVMIPKVVNYKLQSGLYLNGTFDSKDFSFFTSIDKINDIAYIFNSREQAEHFINREKDIEILKAKLEHKKMKKQSKNIDKETTNLIQDEELKKLHHLYEKIQHEQELQRLRHKNELDHKNFVRESLVSTVKTTSIVLTGCVVLYNILNKLKTKE